MGKVTERRIQYAKALIEEGIDLSKNYFALTSSEESIVGKYMKLFGYNGRNYMGRTYRQQFYYSAQAGYAHMDK